MVTGCFCPPPHCCSRDFSRCVQGSELWDGARCGTAALGFANLPSPPLGQGSLHFGACSCSTGPWPWPHLGFPTPVPTSWHPVVASSPFRRCSIPGRTSQHTLSYAEV